MKTNLESEDEGKMKNQKFFFNKQNLLPD